MRKRKQNYFRDQLPPDPVEDCRKSCMYLRDGVCHFLLDTGYLRGCDPGKKCTRYKRRRANET